MDNRFRFPIMAVSMLLLTSNTMTQECGQVSKGPVFQFPRIFIMEYEGEASIIANRSLAAKNLGNCRTTEEHAEEMFRNFEGFGVDLSSMRRNPYEVYDTSNFSVSPYVGTPNGYQRIIMKSFYEYAEVVNYPVVFSSWLLRAKSNLTGPSRSLPAGYWSLSGLFRIMDGGDGFCWSYLDKSPLTPFFDLTIPVALEFIIEDKIWGRGLASSIGFHNNGIFSGKRVITFPGTV